MKPRSFYGQRAELRGKNNLKSRLFSLQHKTLDHLRLPLPFPAQRQRHGRGPPAGTGLGWGRAGLRTGVGVRMWGRGEDVGPGPPSPGRSVPAGSHLCEDGGAVGDGGAGAGGP